MILDTPQILAMPRFPEYKEEIGKDGVVTFKSTVYGHLENYSRVDVYLIPVITMYKTNELGTESKQQFLNAHLQRCLVTSKYYKCTEENLRPYPVIDSISKLEGEETFMLNLHTKYP